MNECMKERFLSKQRFFAGHKGMRAFDQNLSCMQLSAYAKNRLIEASKYFNCTFFIQISSQMDTIGGSNGTNSKKDECPNNPGTCVSKLDTIDGSNGTNSKNELGTL